MRMIPRRWERRTRLLVIAGLFLISIIVLCFVPPIPLGTSYHLFADDRRLFGIPNCLNVLSNVPFMIVGVLSLEWLFRKRHEGPFTVRAEWIPYVIFFAGVTLTGFGSAWYHLSPTSSRLPWDLLPMTCCFMSMVAVTIAERINSNAGLSVLLPLLVAGMASVAYWYFTEARGHGDYRFYLYVEFVPPLLLGAIVALFPPKYTATKYLIVAFCFFVAAKLFELFDRQILGIFRLVSGHSLKHVTAGLACYWILVMLKRRKLINDTQV